MKSLKNYKYKILNKEHRLISEIGRVFQAISHYNIKEHRNKVDHGLALITSYQAQIDELKQKPLKSDMYV